MTRHSIIIAFLLVAGTLLAEETRKAYTIRQAPSDPSTLRGGVVADHLIGQPRGSDVTRVQPCSGEKLAEIKAHDAPLGPHLSEERKGLPPAETARLGRTGSRKHSRIQRVDVKGDVHRIR